MVRISLDFLLLLFIGSYQAFGVESGQSELGYLMRYGYLVEELTLLSVEKKENRARKAVLKFQAFAGLELTGELDKKTREKMETPRCGLSDVIANYVVEGSKWEKEELTFSILKYPTNSRISNQDVDQTVEKAFTMWENESNLVFRRINSGNADIKISFEKYEHEDDKPFDGQGGVLAHAFFPQYGGDIHVDDSENWTIDEFNGKNFLQTFLHELGHSLGLEHSDVTSSVMAPFYRGWDPFLRITEDDKMAITSIYGAKKSKSKNIIISNESQLIWS
eukprot:GFUD01003738.1.p1 GENE.GFUD01003738.1~~GFUD01003738.1.p1  ORF type:complete len:277 (+),score=69.85 GFUD01003738.1:77-907(+)